MILVLQYFKPTQFQNSGFNTNLYMIHDSFFGIISRTNLEQCDLGTIISITVI